MNPTLNAKGRKFSWSFSRLGDYENCPLKYACASFYCTSPYTQSKEAKWGDGVHKAGEMFLKAKGPINLEHLKPVEPYVTAMLRSGHRVEAEMPITLTSEFKPTTWFADDAWLRIKIDVTITKSKKVTDGKSVAVLYDFKTGKRISDSEEQLRLGAAVLSTIRPWYEYFEGKYIWTAHKKVTGIKPITKEEIPGIWEDFLPRVAKMQRAWDTDTFPATPSGLCPWCPVANCPKRRGEMRK